MKLPYSQKWFLLEKEDYANYLFVFPNWEGTTEIVKKWKFLPLHYAGAEYINSACNLFLLKEVYDRNNESHFQKLFSRPQDWDKLHLVNKLNSDYLFKLGKKIKRLKPKNLSNKELVKQVDLLNKAQVQVHVPRLSMWLLETPNNLVSNYLQNYLNEQAEILKTKTAAAEAYRIMITSLKKSNWTKEQEELAKISLIKNKKEQDRQLLRHVKKYEWLEYGMQGGVLGLDHFKAELVKIKKKGALKFLRNLQEELQDINQRQKEIIKEYKIGRQHCHIFKIVRDSLFVRLYSKDAQFFGYYCWEPIFKEVGRRSGLSLEQIRFLAPSEFAAVLHREKDFSAVTLKRQKYSLHISDQGKTMMYLGDQAKRIMKKIKFHQEVVEHKGTEEIKGQPAYNGLTRGRVKIVNTAAEMIKIHPGNILVSHMTNPSIVPAMKKAAAIVTDAGGITCHAAIVARELRKPCIIGTKIATQVLKDGDLVEVDAEKGTVKIIKK